MTAADLAADSLIRARLPGILPDTLVITEETFSASQAANLPARFVLVDPLDGTREFVAGRDEFTVNIALVEGDKPVAGTIMPVRRRDRSVPRGYHRGRRHAAL